MCMFATHQYGLSRNAGHTLVNLHRYFFLRIRFIVWFPIENGILKILMVQIEMWRFAIESRLEERGRRSAGEARHPHRRAELLGVATGFVAPVSERPDRVGASSRFKTRTFVTTSPDLAVILATRS